MAKFEVKHEDRAVTLYAEENGEMVKVAFCGRVNVLDKPRFYACPSTRRDGSHFYMCDLDLHRLPSLPFLIDNTREEVTVKYQPHGKKRRQTVTFNFASVLNDPEGFKAFDEFACAAYDKINR